MTEGTQTALIQEPMALMAYFAALLGAVFMLAQCENQYI